MRLASGWRRLAVAAAALWIGSGCASDGETTAAAPGPADQAATAQAPPPEVEPTPPVEVRTTSEPAPPAEVGTTSEPAPDDAALPQSTDAPAPPSPAADEPPPATSPPALAPADGRVPHVALVQFTTGVENHEPVDAVTFLGNDVREILFYSDLRDLGGATVIHRWEYMGEVTAEVPFEVRGERWRVWSSKRLQPEQVGDWSVSVVAPDGEVLAVEAFSYQQAR